MSVIGDNIHALRILHGITQQELADVAEVTRETVNKWETGAIGNVRTSNVNRLREYFNLSIDDLRSETCGLAARLSAQNTAIGSGEAAAQVPVLTLFEICNGVRTASSDRSVEVPASVQRHHPNSFAFVIDDSMNRVIPESCYAIADPDAKANSDSIVLVRAPNQDDTLLPRRLQRGQTKAILSAESYAHHEDDIVMDVSDLHIVGTVVWFQPQREL